MLKKEELGKLIQENRRKLKMTQQDLAEKLHVSDKAISNWETGKNYPDLLILQELNDTLNLNINDTLTDKRKKAYIVIVFINILFVGLIISLSFFAYYYYKYKNRYIVYDISLNESFSMNNGSVLINNNTIIFKLDTIDSNKFKSNTTIDITLTDQNNNDIFYKRNFIGDTKLSFDVLTNDYINIRKNINNLILKIDYIDVNGESKSEIIPITLSEIFDDTNEKQLQIDNKKILLLNNGFTESKKNYYTKSKEIDDIIINLSYSMKEKTFYYEFNDDNIYYTFYLDEKNNMLFGVTLKKGLIDNVIEDFAIDLNSKQITCNIGNCDNVSKIYELVNNEYKYIKI